MKQLTKKELKKELKESQIERSQDIVLVMENTQYARNVASIFRIADGAGVSQVYLTGISHKPPFGKELQQVSRKKEKSVRWEHQTDTTKLLQKLKKEGYWICAIEYTDTAFPVEKLPIKTQGKAKIAFVAGSEVYGVTKKTLELCDDSVFIPMYGLGASINVTHAVAVVVFRI